MERDRGNVREPTMLGEHNTEVALPAQTTLPTTATPETYVPRLKIQLPEPGTWPFGVIQQAEGALQTEDKCFEKEQTTYNDLALEAKVNINSQNCT